MSRWFRVYDDMIDDPKVQLLSPELFKTWVNLLALASKNGGKLPVIQTIAFALRSSQQDAQSRIDDLVLGGLIDIMPDGSLEPHNWAKRQWKSDDSADRVRRHRGKKRRGNDDVTVTVTPPDSDSESETDNNPLPPSQSSTDELLNNLNVGVGSGWGKISPETKARVCRLLNITDCDEIEARFWAWQRKLPPSKRARDPEAVFVSGAEKLLSRLTPEQRDKLKAHKPEPPSRPPAKASASLVASVRGPAHAR